MWRVVALTAHPTLSGLKGNFNPSLIARIWFNIDISSLPSSLLTFVIKHRLNVWVCCHVSVRYSSWTAAGCKIKSRRKQREQNMWQPGGGEVDAGAPSKSAVALLRLPWIISCFSFNNGTCCDRCRSDSWSITGVDEDFFSQEKILQSCQQLLTTGSAFTGFFTQLQMLLHNSADGGASGEAKLVMPGMASCPKGPSTFWNEYSCCTENDDCVWISVLRFLLLLLFPWCCLLSPVLMWQLMC